MDILAIASSLILIVYNYYNLKRRNYTIRKGSNGYPFDFAFHYGRKAYNFKFAFDDGCLYSWSYTQQVNKLFGWSYGRHHFNSVRIGWRPNKEGTKIEVSLYTYNNGERIIEKLGEVDINKIYFCSLYVKHDMIYVSITSKNEVIFVGNRLNRINSDYRLGYYLFPYFGGRVTAGQKMRIRIWK